MAEFTQANRPLKVTTPLGADALLLVGFTGTEHLSRLYEFQLDLLRPVAKGPVEFDKLLGQKVGVELVMNDGKSRHFHGIVNKMSQGKKVQLGGDDKESFIQYRAEVVPRSGSPPRRPRAASSSSHRPGHSQEGPHRVPDQVELKGSTSPATSASVPGKRLRLRLPVMEEEGIFFFTHAAGAHDDRGGHAEQPPGPAGQQEVDLRGSLGRVRPEQRVCGGTRSRDPVRKVTLFDHCFEKPHEHLDATRRSPPRSRPGRSATSCRTATSQLEQYDYPGGYAGRFDGIDKGAARRRGSRQDQRGQQADRRHPNGRRPPGPRHRRRRHRRPDDRRPQVTLENTSTRTATTCSLASSTPPSPRPTTGPGPARPFLPEPVRVHPAAVRSAGTGDPSPHARRRRP